MTIANYMAEFTDIEQVWFVISPHNPLKEKKTLLNQNQRLYMVNAAVEDFPKFRSSNIEFNLPQPSYTINTLAYLKEKYPAHKFSLIMGQDNLETFNKWKNHEQILLGHKLYIYPRPDSKKSEYDNHKQVVFTEAPMMDISSTFIREAIKNKKNMHYFIPEKAREYIEAMNLYK